MEREIKFRAFHKATSEWQEWTLGDLWDVGMPPNTNEYFEFFEIMQYTGITDKNGQEIYEGDILKWDPKEWGSEYSEVVEWDFELLNARQNDWPQFCEVIGNIHENPELLKEVK